MQNTLPQADKNLSLHPPSPQSFSYRVLPVQLSPEQTLFSKYHKIQVAMGFLSNIKLEECWYGRFDRNMGA